MLEIKTFVFNPVGVNTYVLSDESKQCVLVDPGCLDGRERDELTEYVEERHLQPVAVWLTHLHFDHIYGVPYCRERWCVPVWGGAADAPFVPQNNDYTQSWGLPPSPDVTLDRALREGDELAVGASLFRVIVTPGHSAGSLSYYCEKEKFLFAGDTIFQHSIGRTDLPGGDHAALLSSITGKVLSLPPECMIFSGHGPATSVGEEQLYNPHLLY